MRLLSPSTSPPKLRTELKPPPPPPPPSSLPGRSRPARTIPVPSPMSFSEKLKAAESESDAMAIVVAAAAAVSSGAAKTAAPASTSSAAAAAPAAPAEPAKEDESAAVPAVDRSAAAAASGASSTPASTEVAVATIERSPAAPSASSSDSRKSRPGHKFTTGVAPAAAAAVIDMASPSAAVTKTKPSKWAVGTSRGGAVVAGKQRGLRAGASPAGDAADSGVSRKAAKTSLGTAADGSDASASGAVFSSSSAAATVRPPAPAIPAPPSLLLKKTGSLVIRKKKKVTGLTGGAPVMGAADVAFMKKGAVAAAVAAMESTLSTAKTAPVNKSRANSSESLAPIAVRSREASLSATKPAGAKGAATIVESIVPAPAASGKTATASPGHARSSSSGSSNSNTSADVNSAAASAATGTAVPPSTSADNDARAALADVAIRSPAAAGDDHDAEDRSGSVAGSPPSDIDGAVDDAEGCDVCVEETMAGIHDISTASVAEEAGEQEVVGLGIAAAGGGKEEEGAEESEAPTPSLPSDRVAEAAGDDQSVSGGGRGMRLAVCCLGLTVSLAAAMVLAAGAAGVTTRAPASVIPATPSNAALSDTARASPGMGGVSPLPGTPREAYLAVMIPRAVRARRCDSSEALPASGESEEAAISARGTEKLPAPEGSDEIGPERIAEAPAAEAGEVPASKNSDPVEQVPVAESPATAESEEDGEEDEELGVFRGKSAVGGIMSEAYRRRLSLYPDPVETDDPAVAARLDTAPLPKKLATSGGSSPSPPSPTSPDRKSFAQVLADVNSRGQAGESDRRQRELELWGEGADIEAAVAAPRPAAVAVPSPAVSASFAASSLDGPANETTKVAEPRTFVKQKVPDLEEIVESRTEERGRRASEPGGMKSGRSSSAPPRRPPALDMTLLPSSGKAAGGAGQGADLQLVAGPAGQAGPAAVTNLVHSSSGGSREARAAGGSGGVGQADGGRGVSPLPWSEASSGTGYACPLGDGPKISPSSAWVKKRPVSRRQRQQQQEPRSSRTHAVPWRRNPNPVRRPPVDSGTEGCSAGCGNAAEGTTGDEAADGRRIAMMEAGSLKEGDPVGGQARGGQSEVAPATDADAISMVREGAQVGV